MNFLLHRHFALAELGSERSGVGAMLPDLWRLAGIRNGHGRRHADDRPSRRSSPEIGVDGDRPSQLPGVDPTGVTSAWLEARDEVVRAPDAYGQGAPPDLLAAGADDLARGVAHHYETDRWFHATRAFLEGERLTAAVLRGCCNGAVPKLGLFAHVLWEMSLDGAHLRRVGLEASLVALRRTFTALDVGELVAVGLQGAQEGARAAAEGPAHDRLAQVLDHLLAGGWLEAYCTGEGMCLPLGGIRTRLGLSFFSPAECAVLAPSLDELLRAAGYALDELAAERAAHRAAL